MNDTDRLEFTGLIEEAKERYVTLDDDEWHAWRCDREEDEWKDKNPNIQLEIKEKTNDIKTCKAFYIALPHSQADILWDKLKKYTTDDEKLILAKEISKKSHQDISGEHFHVLVEWDTARYEAFKKTIIDKHYKLCGKAEKGGHRKYGIVRQIRDYHKMLSYTIKGNDFKQQNYTKEEIDEALANSFEKEDPKAYQEILMSHLSNIRDTFHSYNDEEPHLAIYQIKPVTLELAILEHHMTNKDKPLCRSKLDYYTNYYLQCVEPLRS
jgi:hypothetical protein